MSTIRKPTIKTWLGFTFLVCLAVATARTRLDNGLDRQFAFIGTTLVLASVLAVALFVRRSVLIVLASIGLRLATYATFHWVPVNGGLWQEFVEGLFFLDQLSLSWCVEVLDFEFFVYWDTSIRWLVVSAIGAIFGLAGILLAKTCYLLKEAPKSE